MYEATMSAWRTPEHSSNVTFALASYMAEIVTYRMPPTPFGATCGHCGTLSVRARYSYNGKCYCSAECSHKAGNRSHCRRGCGCTDFAIKRRQLRDMRKMMRAMQTVINDNGLWGALDEELETPLGLRGQLAILDSDPEMDEGSDVEDPMVTQANEIGAVSDIVQLSRIMVELAEIRRGQKRARSEDQGA